VFLNSTTSVPSVPGSNAISGKGLNTGRIRILVCDTSLYFLHIVRDMVQTFCVQIIYKYYYEMKIITANNSLILGTSVRNC
jgi:hypothetical protein